MSCTVGVFVLPSAITPTLPLPQAAQPGKDNSSTGVMRVEDGGKQMTHVTHVPRAKRKKKPRGNRSQNNNQQLQTTQSRSNVNFYGTSEWQYSDDMMITDIQDLHLLDEFISQKVRVV